MAEIEKTENGTKRGGSNLFSLIKAVVIIVLIVVLECVAVAMFLPSSEETAQFGRRIANATSGNSGNEDSSTKSDSGQLDLREVNIGHYYITSYQPESNTTLRIDFELCATVLASDVPEFEALYEQHQHRLSEQVHVTFRRAELTDLTDAGLGLIKRLILEKSNRTLGKPLIHEVVFSQFSFIEQ
ncbi:MAG: hypothetical protein JW829_09310 [Pirellulales bacterium]|nr:hypothetical protein [Pirellulales bacterium]